MVTELGPLFPLDSLGLLHPGPKIVPDAFEFLGVCLAGEPNGKEDLGIGTRRGEVSLFPFGVGRGCGGFRGGAPIPSGLAFPTFFLPSIVTVPGVTRGGPTRARGATRAGRTRAPTVSIAHYLRNTGVPARAMDQLDRPNK